MDLCPYCNSVLDEVEGEVCKNCGIVLEDSTIECANFNSNYVPSDKKKILRSKVAALSTLETMFSLYAAKEEIRSKTKSLFEKILEKDKIKYSKSITELAGCCFYVCLRENNEPVLLETFCSQLGCTISHFNYVKKLLKSHLDINILPASIVSMIPTVLSSMPDDRKDLLIDKTKKLVELCDSCWISSGRSRQSIIIAAAYFCWKSLEPQRMKVPFVKFCKEFNFEIKQAKLRVNEITSLLLKLAQFSSLPKYGFIVNKSNLSTKLDYILERSQILRSEMLGNKHDKDEIDNIEYNSFRKTKKRFKPSSSVSTPISDNLAKDSENEILISDSEIDEYIRTEEEIQRVEKIKRLLKK